MTSTQTTSQDSSTEHNHYWQDGLIPVTPQARRFGYPTETYVTPLIWKEMCVWTEGRGTNTDKRLTELLKDCFWGLSKALSVEDDMLSFTFKHWYMKRKKPKAKKRSTAKLGARLLLHPETEEPWLLIFDPEYDFTTQLKKGDPPDGKPEQNCDDGADSGKQESADGPALG